MKTAKTNCEHCRKEIKVKGFASWQKMWRVLEFRKANHELMHLLNGTDVYSQMERGLQDALRNKDD